MEYPTRGNNVIQDDVRHLHHQPRHDNVGDGYLEYVTTLEFVVEGQGMESKWPLVSASVLACPVITNNCVSESNIY